MAAGLGEGLATTELQPFAERTDPAPKALPKPSGGWTQPPVYQNWPGGACESLELASEKPESEVLGWPIRGLSCPVRGLE